MSNTTATVRASSWGRLFDCAHSWEAQHLLGMFRPAGMPALLGTSIHAGSAAFDTAKLEGHLIKPADAVEVMVDALRHPDQEYDLTGSDMTLDKAAKVGAIALVNYCVEISPRYTFLAVERKLTPMDITIGDVTIRLTGSMDRARTIASGSGKGICDVKTGRRAVVDGQAVTKKHKAQLGTYELLEEHETGEACSLPAEIIALPTSGDYKPAVGTVTGARAAMVGEPGSPGLLHYAAEMFRSGLFPPNPQSSLCSPKFCARWDSCKFR